MKRPLGAAALALALLAAGCGDDDAPHSAAEGTTTTAEDVTTTTHRPTATAVPPRRITVAASDDAWLAEQALLTVDDFPAGWTVAPDEPDDDTGSEDLDGPECAHLRGSNELLGGGAEAEATFTSPDGAVVGHIVTVGKQEAVEAELATLADERTTPCLEAMFTAVTEQHVEHEDLTLVDVELSRVPVDAGDEAVAHAGDVNVRTTDGLVQATIRVRFDVVQVGRAVSVLAALVPPAARAPDFDALDAAAAERMAAVV
jgi:hypothetical protein